MTIKFYAPEWGNTLPFAAFCRNVKQAGYDGVEMSLPFEIKEKRTILTILKDYDLELIGQYWQSLEKDLAEHAKNYERYLQNLIEAQPQFINCQTGKDYYNFAQNKHLFDLAARMSKASGVKITHETHRGTFGFTILSPKHAAFFRVSWQVWQKVRWKMCAFQMFGFPF